MQTNTQWNVYSFYMNFNSKTNRKKNFCHFFLSLELILVLHCIQNANLNNFEQKKYKTLKIQRKERNRETVTEKYESLHVERTNEPKLCQHQYEEKVEISTMEIASTLKI